MPVSFLILLLSFWSNHISFFFSLPILLSHYTLVWRAEFERRAQYNVTVQFSGWDTPGEGRGGEVGKIAFNGDVLLLRLERYISARPSCV